MPDIAIKVEGLSKPYRIGGKQERYKTLREKLSALNSDLINDPITNDQ